MKKVTSPKQIRVRRKMDASRPTYKSGVYKNTKPVRTRLPEKIGTTLDNYEIEQIKLE